jgi:hypothetical protein
MKCLRNKRDILENILLPLWADPFDRQTIPHVQDKNGGFRQLPKPNAYAGLVEALITTVTLERLQKKGYETSK